MTNDRNTVEQQHEQAQAASRAVVSAMTTAMQRLHVQRLEWFRGRPVRLEHLEDKSLIATYETTGDDGAVRHNLAAFLGRAERPDRRFYCYFRSAEQRQARVDALTQSRVKRIKEAHAPHSLSVGSVLYSSWGYEQTNVDFYEVIAVRGRVVDIQELKQDRTFRADMQGTTMPRVGDFTGEVMLGKRPRASNEIRIHSSAFAWLWDGSPKCWSSYS